MTAAPYGSWKSPITAALLVQDAVTLSDVQVDGDTVYWCERRPSEGGRTVVVRGETGAAGGVVVSDAIPEGFNARTTVHEYGGGAYLARGGTVFFSHFDDQRVYRLDAGAAAPQPITAEPPTKWGYRYADMRLRADGRSLVCVRETHPADGAEARNEVVVLPSDGSDAPVVVAGGHDFYAAPRLSPDGNRLAYYSWDHPRMPWDGTELWVVAVDADCRPASEAQRVAGGPQESVIQPRWSPDGVLHYLSDRNGWWNLYTEDGTALASRAAEFGSPPWAFGQSSYCFVDGGIACIWSEAGSDRLGTVPRGGGAPRQVELPYTNLASVRPIRTGVVLLAGSPTNEQAVVEVDLAGGTDHVVRRSRDGSVDAGYLSVPEAVAFPTEGGAAHAFYYPPANKDFTGPDGERPPLLVVSHGGPTGATSSVLSLRTQYWTSRGIAVVDVNYGGSSGYGREYRQRLAGTWGITDVVDCINAARFLTGRGDVDGERVLIRGGSAGGYTTLCALAFHDFFAAGASHFGVADAEALARDTHKFESRYLDGLIGPYPEARDTYMARSPIHFADQISCPLILFQGLDDKVVPPAQSEQMAAALDKNGIPHAYLAFAGEQHGFRQAENIVRSFEAELYFYSRVLGFPLAEPIAPVSIAHLEF
jgi:dipeptidyl aminopeptidase/acylaminoacyl peptidase